MRKKIGVACIVLLGIGALGCFNFLSYFRAERSKTIGILIPIEHTALREIVTGFQKKINEHFKNAVVFNVQSAQGDIKLQRSILELFIGQQVDMIVPIGTSTTQMTLALVKEQPIVSLAALYFENDRQKRNPKNMTGVLDEIGGKKKLDFIKAIIPHVKTITLFFHAGNEKTFAEVEEISNYAKQLGIMVQAIMVQNLVDFEIAMDSIAKESQAILILKDNLIASGIRRLVAAAEKHHIPLITGDEGTVSEGATFGLGVRENKIGEEGALLAIKVLSGYPIEELPIQEMQEISLFYNPTRCKAQEIDLAVLQEYAKKRHYSLVAVERLGNGN